MSVYPRDGASHQSVQIWLGLVASLVALTAIVGAATRLTGSGLSITEWNPILGAIPPLTKLQWLEAFAKYQAIPQFQKMNAGMSLADFRTIFWWEWGHRLLARSIGVVFALPLLAFWVRGQIPVRLMPRLIGILLLGGMQGAIGWYMVQSGLVDRIDVSQYRLALHLGVAMAILGLTLWTICELGTDRERRHLATITASQIVTATVLIGLVYLQILTGALVAGLKAGRTYNTWPLMDGALLPDGLAKLTPLWLNLFENAATVQFNHRLLAYLLLAVAVLQAVSVNRTADDERVGTSARILLLAVFAQAALGVWTLLAWVPIGLGVAHQAGAMLVLVVAVWHLYTIRRASRA